jgi:pSer/pThr/pTyr-binding forkhead associated (FHA) protein
MPKLLITKGPERGRVLKIAADAPPTLGREGADIAIDDSYISKKHARFFMKDGRWHIEDLGSANGTYVNEKRVTEPVKLRRGDRVQIGQTKMIVSPKTGGKDKPPSDAGKKPEPVIDTASPPPPSDKQKVKTDSLDASSMLLDVLGNITVEDVSELEEDDDIGDYIPDYDPLNPLTHRSRKKKTPGDKPQTKPPSTPDAKPDA